MLPEFLIPTVDLRRASLRQGFVLVLLASVVVNFMQTPCLSYRVRYYKSVRRRTCYPSFPRSCLGASSNYKLVKRPRSAISEAEEQENMDP